MPNKIEAPYWWQNFSRAVRFLFASLILVFSTSSIYPQATNMKIIFFMSMAMMFLQAADIFLGVKKVKGDDDDVSIPTKP